MFPIVAIGGVIGAAVSIAKGVSWVADQLDSASNSASVGGKGDGKTQSQAKVSDFESALSAQVAGQNQPTGVSSTQLTSHVLNDTGQDTAARIRAGLAAYSFIGDHRDGQTKPDGTATAGTVAPS